MKKIKVIIEEHLSKTIEIEIPDNLTKSADRIDYTIDKVRNLYQNQEITLDSLDYNGTTLIQLTDTDTNIETDWIEL